MLGVGAEYVFKAFLVLFVTGIVDSVLTVALAVNALTGLERHRALPILSGTPGEYIVPPATVLYIMASSLLVALAGVLLSLTLLRSGMKMLRSYDVSRYSVGYTGALLLIAGTVLGLVATAIMAITAYMIAGDAYTYYMAGMCAIGIEWINLLVLAALLLRAAGLLLLLGAALTALALWRLGGEAGKGLARAGALLWLLGMALSIAASMSPVSLRVATEAGGILVLAGSALIMAAARSIAATVARLTGPGPRSRG